MVVELEASAWAEQQFKGCQLGDKRLNHRLVSVMSRLAKNRGGTIAQACKGDDAALEAGYRFIRNPYVKVKALMEAGFAATCAAVNDAECVLAIDDTSTLSYQHSVASSLGDTGGKRSSRRRGFWVHSTLMVDATTGVSYGLSAQHWWQRPMLGRGKSEQRRGTDYTEKESYKWQRNAEAMRARLGDKMRDIIAVSDRESDIYVYLHHKHEHGERFIVRAAQDRVIKEHSDGLFETLGNAGKYGEVIVDVPQRGGRSARQATLTLRACSVTLKAPKNNRDAVGELTLNAVLAQEETSAEKEPLRWLLLTTEAIRTDAEVKDVLRCYRLRWHIEEFHKAWKSGGSQVEALRLEKAEHLERMGVMLAFIAVRIMQLREAVDNAAAAERPCTDVLTDTQWKLLWVSQKKKSALPGKTPTLKWASQTLAKLGGFYDSKRTGRASWSTYYQGWMRLEELVNGYTLAAALDAAVS